MRFSQSIPSVWIFSYALEKKQVRLTFLCSDLSLSNKSELHKLLSEMSELITGQD